MEARICREVRLFLKKHKMPVLQLAELSGVSQSSISRLLNGKRGDIQSRNADALRDAMRHYEAYRLKDGEG